jgi:NADH:ubiquinone oxidoreductase subunit 2 (subunit N)
MLYGIFLVFITLGTGHLLELGQTLATQTETVSNGVNLLELGVTLLFVGLFFKLSAFPGHL